MSFPLYSPQPSVSSNNMKTKSVFHAVMLVHFYMSISHSESYQHCQLLFTEAQYKQQV